MTNDANEIARRYSAQQQMNIELSQKYPPAPPIGDLAVYFDGAIRSHYEEVTVQFMEGGFLVVTSRDGRTRSYINPNAYHRVVFAELDEG